MSGELCVRRASSADLTVMRAVAGSCSGAPQWSAGAWEGLLIDGGARAGWVAEIKDEVVGFIVASCTAAIAEIESVAVLEAARRRGVGRALCAEAMAWARGCGADSIELEVRASNASAMGLYAALGFVEQGRRKGYYREPAEDAVLMAARL